jgi:hypothetical protein
MGRWPANVLILFAIALLLANAECFTRCLVHPADNASMPCHSGGKAKTNPPQHDFELIQVHSQPPAGSQAAAPVYQPEIPLPNARESLSIAASPSPPILDPASSPLPLRI